jgi:diguanylate cyclase (GGDEF)-like protein/PAS domain S-box-containing protein
MADALGWLFGAAAFVPHGYCLLWRPDLVALHATSDAATALAYFSIPAAILVFFYRRPDVEYPAVAVLFAIFILGCGLTHVADLLTLWWPIYGVEGLLKAITAAASFATSVVVWRLLPGALLVPSPAQLRQANEELNAEVVRRASVEAALARTLDGLEALVAERTRELADTNLRLQSEIAERARAERTARDGESRLAIVAERLRLAVEATELGIWDVDARTGRREWSQEQKAILGLPADCLADSALFTSLIHPEDRDRVSQQYGRAYDSVSGGTYQAQFRIFRARDGTERWVQATGRVHFDAAGNPIRGIGTLADVTERRRTELALQERTAELETVLDTVPIAVWLAHDQEARRITGNRAAAARLRLTAADNLSLVAPEGERPKHFQVYQDGEAARPEQLPLQRAACGEVVRNAEIRVRFDDGTYYDELVCASPIREASGRIIGAVGAAVDITERKAAEERIRHLAMHDPLTGLPNRTLLHDRLIHAIARAKRRREHVAVMLLDLDQFKEINDALGHLAGDALLREVAARLKTVARASDTWARLGGDEFALVQEGLQQLDGVPVMASRILAALKPPFHLDGREMGIAGSLGITVYPNDGRTPEQLIRNADVALYRAKAAGRSRFEPYRSDFDRELRRSSRLQSELRSALENEALDLVYQPVFELPHQRLIKIEALLRLRRSDGSHLAPAAFIPQAESSGLIHPLGQWVLTTACRQGAAWLASGSPLKVAVNISPVQLRALDFSRSVRSILEQAGLPPHLLELEVTESVFLDGSKAQIREALRQLAAMGLTLTIDDFGTGYSSLAYLRHFPFHEVKIDGSFIADIGQGPTGGAIAAAVIGLAHSLGKRVTAEGVETHEQLEYLRERGCDAAQGYLLARPGPANGLVSARLAVA